MTLIITPWKDYKLTVPQPILSTFKWLVSNSSILFSEPIYLDHQFAVVRFEVLLSTTIIIIIVVSLFSWFFIKMMDESQKLMILCFFFFSLFCRRCCLYDGGLSFFSFYQSLSISVCTGCSYNHWRVFILTHLRIHFFVFLSSFCLLRLKQNQKKSSKTLVYDVDWVKTYSWHLMTSLIRYIYERE